MEEDDDSSSPPPPGVVFIGDPLEADDKQASYSHMRVGSEVRRRPPSLTLFLCVLLCDAARSLAPPPP